MARRSAPVQRKWDTLEAGVAYKKKFSSFRGKTLFEGLTRGQKAFLREVAFTHRLTFQEFRSLTEVARDLDMWGESGLDEWWRREAAATALTGRELKEHLLGRVHERVEALRRIPGTYPPARGASRPRRTDKPFVVEKTDKKIWGLCPVASDKTICCQLRTIDAVENCPFGCSYCIVQTFYTERFAFDAEFAQKLQSIALDPDRFFHFGTGQASDSLAWGNRNGNLDALVEFAARHPNVLLELKTKSDNVKYIVENRVPDNVVCSWSLNTPAVIDAEEHFTASLERRVAAARAVADAGVGIAFHFHPMVLYDAWEKDYREVAKTLLDSFDAGEVRFVSFGSVTLIKPVIRKIRELGAPGNILRAELVADPLGKLTYRDDVKVDMFRAMNDAFAPWRGPVFLYLCMEKRSIWERSFGYVYENNDQFEAEFGRRTLALRPAKEEP